MVGWWWWWWLWYAAICDEKNSELATHFKKLISLTPFCCGGRNLDWARQDYSFFASAEPANAPASAKPKPVLASAKAAAKPAAALQAAPVAAAAPELSPHFSHYAAAAEASSAPAKPKPTLSSSSAFSSASSSSGQDAGKAAQQPIPESPAGVGLRAAASPARAQASAAVPLELSGCRPNGPTASDEAASDLKDLVRDFTHTHVHANTRTHVHVQRRIKHTGRPLRPQVVHPRNTHNQNPPLPLSEIRVT